MPIEQINFPLVKHQLSRIGKAFLMPLYLEKKTLPFKPTFISLEVEETCFFRCKQCNIWKNKRLKDRMSQEQMQQTLKKLSRWLGTFQISFTGGEPLSNPYFIPVIEYARKLGIVTHVNTNAYLITPALAKRIIDSGINSISISIDGYRSSHNKNRGRPKAFERAEAAIELLKKGKKKRRFFLSTTTVLMKQNIGELEELLRWGRRIGLDGMHFQPLWENFSTARHDENWYKKGGLWPDPQDSVAGLKRLIAWKKKGWLVANSLSQLQSYLAYYGKGPVHYGSHHPCFVGVRNFAIAINGEVRLCYFFEPVGNILKQSPQAIWNGPVAQKMRAKINRCQRGCKILLCNTELNRKEAVDLLLEQGKRFVTRRVFGRENA